MTQRQKHILDTLLQSYETKTTELHYTTLYELMIAVMLSAQTTDAKVNQVSPALFTHIQSKPQNMHKLSQSEILRYIRGVNYAPTKAKNLKKMAGQIINNYNGNIPHTRDELMNLAGIWQKSANVIMAVYHKGPYIPVDTHVLRVSYRLGLSKNKTPIKVERDLERIIPPHLRADGHHVLVLHGRYTCKARSPECKHCPLYNVCKSKDKKKL